MPQGSNIALYLGSAYGITLGVLTLLRVAMAVRIHKLRQEQEALHG